MAKIMIAAGAAFVLLSALLWFLLSRAPADTTPPRFLYCPECGLSLGFHDSLKGKPCPHCGPKGPALLPTHSLTSREVPTPVWHKLLAANIVALVVLEGLLYAFLGWRRLQHHVEQQNGKAAWKCRCPFCQRKIRFPSSRAGMGALCPRCKTAFCLPTAAEASVSERADN